ncbi:lytic transglycosylase domain-containing protein, partial [Mycolicibacterium brumae]
MRIWGRKGAAPSPSGPDAIDTADVTSYTGNAETDETTAVEALEPVAEVDDTTVIETVEDDEVIKPEAETDETVVIEAVEPEVLEPAYAEADETVELTAVGELDDTDQLEDTDELTEPELVDAGVYERKPKRFLRPLAGAAVLTPLMLAAAVAGSGPPLPGQAPAIGVDISPMAAVMPAPPDLTVGPSVVSVAKAPETFNFATKAISAPPPAVVMAAIGSLRIPAISLDSYRNAEAIMAQSAPNCGVSWNLLAGIGKIESGHASSGATDRAGTTVNPIYGPTLDGSLAGNEVIVQSVTSGRVVYARAMGPMQFLPGTWSRYASDGNSDGVADPQNVYDASLAAARYLCSGGMNLRDQSQVVTAILRYNNSMAYTQNVLGWSAAYATGVEPGELPAIGADTHNITPRTADQHLAEAATRGLGPDMNDDGETIDPLANQHSAVANQMVVPPGPAQEGEESPVVGRCAVFCLENSVATPAAVNPAAEQINPMAPPAPFNPFAPAAPAPAPFNPFAPAAPAPAPAAPA